MTSSDTSPMRPGEIVAALGNAADLSMGQPVAHGLRAAVLAARLASVLGADIATQDAAYHTTLLRWSGCTANAHEFSRLLGDDVGGRARLQLLEPDEQYRTLASAAAATGAGAGDLAAAMAEHCEVAQLLARRLLLPDTVVDALGQVFERFDGHGAPRGLAGEAIAVPTRLAVLAGDAEILSHHLGLEAALDRLRSRSGRLYDPALVAAAVAEMGGWLDDLARHRDDLWPWTLAQEPAVRAPLRPSALDDIAEALADAVDLKVPHLVGHSRDVARIVSRAGSLLGLDLAQQRLARRAALVHDVGRTAIPNAVWERSGRLTPLETAQERLHPYYTGQVLEPVAALRDIAVVASAHHEHLDGSGYHRQLRADALSPVARLLAAADAWGSARLDRPARPGSEPSVAAAGLRDAVRAGHLDRAAVAAVLEVVGERDATLETRRPGDLTPRELEVLRLLARGMTNADIAARLGVAPKTVSNHVQNLYGRLGVHSRAAATLVGLQSGLVGVDTDPAS